MSDVEITIAGERLSLLPERALWWARERALLIADAHFGKSATFRAYHIPVPEGSLNADLARLARALARTQALKLIILGDLLHTAKGRDAETVATVARWREQHAAVHITLVRGNHDRHAGDPPPAWGMRTVNAPLPMPPFALDHQPREAEAYVLAGHLHPLAQLTGPGKQMLRLPCFWFGERAAVLPAFSEFTDGMLIRPAPHDRVFVVTPSRVMALAPSRGDPRP
jgi:DNA ligase-associated metallophosphoesterase